MVTIIFEGADNLGKSTIIRKIVDNFKNSRDITMLHCTGPHPEEGEDPFVYQQRSFKDKVLKINEIFKTEKFLSTSLKNIVIMDRSWYGEYVYGQIYRKANKDQIAEMIRECNKMLIGDLVVVHLTASPEFVMTHDDNLSITSKMERKSKIEYITKEVKMFDECFEVIPENHIDINVEVKGNTYMNIDKIYEKIMNFIKNLNIEL